MADSVEAEPIQDELAGMPERRQKKGRGAIRGRHGARTIPTFQDIAADRDHPENLKRFKRIQDLSAKGVAVAEINKIIENELAAERKVKQDAERELRPELPGMQAEPSSTGDEAET